MTRHSEVQSKSVGEPRVAAGLGGAGELISRFRLSMRRVAATVAIVTARSEVRLDGMTATAVTSVSAEPPALLVCVNRTASLSPALSRTPEFCVNFLRRGQEEVSRAFSDPNRRAERFCVGQWNIEDDGPPYMLDAQANLFCRRVSEIPFETHMLFLGHVYEARFSDSVMPLIYLDGGYRNVAL
jgi:flavin reductase